MKNEFTKRIITSLFLLTLLVLIFFYSYILIISLIIVSIISWVEFYGLISRIFIQNKFKTNFLKLLIKTLSLIYVTLFSFLIFNAISQVNPNYNSYIIYLFAICICSDIGGLIFGKIFKGKKLTKISPNKTIAGSLGSFILSLILVPFFYYFFKEF